MPDLVVYGVNCMWWDDIENASTNPNCLPCCPHCGSILCEQYKTTWEKQVNEYELNDNPGHKNFIAWLKGKCFKSIHEATNAYYKATGVAVNV